MWKNVKMVKATEINTTGAWVWKFRAAWEKELQHILHLISFSCSEWFKVVNNAAGYILCYIKWNNGLHLGPVLSRALRKFSEENLVIIGSVILYTNCILLIVSNIYCIYTAVILFAIGNELMRPSFMSILSKRAGSVLQGSVQGIAGSFGGLASIIGLILGGFLYILIGPITFLISAGVIFVVFVMSFRLLKIKSSD